MSLLPCPFCGGEADCVKDRSDEDYSLAVAFCCECPAKLYSDPCDGPGAAIKNATAAWNRRAAPSADSGWIACSERMPPVGQAVLIVDSGEPVVGMRSGRYDADWIGERATITHWRPLPPGPFHPEPA